MLPFLVATIISTSVSNSSSGGVVVNSGDSETGSSYSSVSVQTYSNDNGSTSTVQVRTDNNGKVNEQTMTKTAPPGGSIEIDVSTSTGKAWAKLGVSDRVNATTSASSLIPAAVFSPSGSFSFKSFLRNLFDLFGFSW